MAGMQRFVTYLYSYKGNEKLHNTGFAKVEIRGEQCRLEIHLKGTGLGSETFPIYLFTRKNGGMQAIEIGNINFQGGNGDYKGLFKNAEIGHSPYCIQDMDGILILVNESNMFASQWDEEPILREVIRIWEPKLEIPETASTFNEQPEPVILAASAQEEAAGSKSAEAVPEEASEPVPEEEVTGETMGFGFGESAEKTESVRATEIPMRQFFWNRPEPEKKEESLSESFLRLQKKEQTVELFESGDRQVSGIHIELRDIRELPKRYWYLGNNSFLLHGFFNYRYLLLGKRVVDGNETIFLGVPGVYQSQERVMATMFGFPEFLMEKEEESFGYYCHSMDE